MGKSEYLKSLLTELTSHEKELKSIHDELTAKLPEGHYKMYAKCVAKHIAKYQTIQLSYIVEGVSLVASMLSSLELTADDKVKVNREVAKLDKILAFANRK